MDSVLEGICARAQEFLKLTGVRRPVLNAPMATAAGPDLAAAVCRAGGLGVLSGDELKADALARAIDEVRRFAGNEARFAVNLRVPSLKAPSAEALALQAKMLSALEDLARDLQLAPGLTEPLPDFDEQFEVLLEKRVPVVSVTFGGLREVYDDRLKEKGILWMGAAASLREAKVLRAAGADMIVVQGAEAGGPRLNFETEDNEAMLGMALLTAHAGRATGLPVIASGGIATADLACAAMAAGASAVMAGSAFLRTPESRAPQSLKDLLPLVSDIATRQTRCFSGRLTRVVPTDIVQALEESGLSFAPYPLQREVMRPILRAAARCGREDLACFAAGQGAMLARAESAEAVVERLAGFLDAT